ncbi:hypothetical protein PoB_005046400 [Plakobranchus ocellatus]|uniref:Uncharacterized protein n=1 Tax=Plakobranchus ocellatus TaxID=259542 RepID=A0AAV4BUS6_9GAST|nr:hypothetical protein PoB_005046400 [Plakobranchus ocellatus]
MTITAKKLFDYNRHREEALSLYPSQRGSSFTIPVTARKLFHYNRHSEEALSLLRVLGDFKLFVQSASEGDFRLSDPSSGQSTYGGARTRDKTVPRAQACNRCGTATRELFLKSAWIFLSLVQSPSFRPDENNMPERPPLVVQQLAEGRRRLTSPVYRVGFYPYVSYTATRKIRKRQATFFGHVMRREKLENLVTTGMLEGKRSRGKQREKLIEGLADWLKAGKSLEAIEATKDRKKWRTMIANAVKQGT